MEPADKMFMNSCGTEYASLGRLCNVLTNLIPEFIAYCLLPKKMGADVEIVGEANVAVQVYILLLFCSKLFLSVYNFSNQSTVGGGRALHLQNRGLIAANQAPISVS